MKTADLIGDALNWAVAKCDGHSAHRDSFVFHEIPSYSTNWAQGGPIIEREKIAVDCDGVRWVASDNAKPVCYSAPTPLIAAMRCYVASKLGDEIDVPNELTKGETA